MTQVVRKAMTDEAILSVLRKYPTGQLTAVLRNCLQMDGYCKVTTEKVRTALLRMEKVGSVERIKSRYLAQHTWKAV